MHDGPIQETLSAFFLQNAERFGSKVALSSRGDSLTWEQYSTRSVRLARGWLSIGLKPNQKVALMLPNCVDFHVIDTSVLLARGVPFSLAPEDPPERLAKLLAVSEAYILIVAPEYESRARAALKFVQEDPPFLLVLDRSSAINSIEITLEEVIERGESQTTAPWLDASIQDIATLIFTSGSTGEPKCVQLSHRAILSSALGVDKIAPVTQGGLVVSYLPMSHIAERFMSHYLGIVFGLTIHSVPKPDELYAELKKVKPTRFFGVPRIYEKLSQQLQEQLTEEEQRTLNSGLEKRSQIVEAMFDTVRSRAIVASVGLENTEYRGVATAPSSPDVLNTFSALGIPVSNIWGMSEAIMCTMNPPECLKLDSVGVFLPGVEGKIALDGEVLVRGRNLYSGYLTDDPEVKDLLDSEGWLHTGDLGSIDDEGYLYLIGRKKDLMVTSTGSNVAPSAVEAALAGTSRLIAHVVTVADNRRYVTVIVSLDSLSLNEFAHQHGLEGNFKELSQHELVKTEISEAIRTANSKLPRAATIRGFIIADREWVVGSGLVTNTLKVRRSAVLDEYEEAIENLYEEQELHRVSMTRGL